ncbi:MAG: non-hydrolyzing UDP-N-acetylglucosamine 2-epimerase, partial [Candidatus Rokuibacteriota bacterium]
MPPPRVLVIVGTRPEVVKMAPVIEALQARRSLETRVCVTGQHGALIEQQLQDFGLRPDLAFQAHQEGQSLGALTGRLAMGLDGVLAEYEPQLVLVQGDTTTALMAALVAFSTGVRVGHVEAGLRSGLMEEPFPEEMNRRLIGQLACLHFAPTVGAKVNLLREGVRGLVEITGNPVVDSLRRMLRQEVMSSEVRDILRRVPEGGHLVVVTMHRRESWGARLALFIRAVRRLVEEHKNLLVVWPLHGNRALAEAVRTVIHDVDRLELHQAMAYSSFIPLLVRAGLVITDSGGVIEEAVTLGARLIIVRNVTERPEAVAAGRASLLRPDWVLGLTEQAEKMLAEAPSRQWCEVFGDGH